jgi:hypothetical protein
MLTFIGVDGTDSLFQYGADIVRVPVAHWQHPTLPNDDEIADHLTVAFTTPDAVLHSVTVPLGGDARTQALFFAHAPSEIATLREILSARDAAWVLNDDGSLPQERYGVVPGPPTP